MQNTIPALPVKASVINLRDMQMVMVAKSTGRFVLIDRRTEWGNPYRIGSDGTREEVIAKYREHLESRPDLLARLPELKGMALACWCAPQKCHGDVIAEMINAL